MIYEFDSNELRMILSGQFTFFKCLECDGEGAWYFKDEKPSNKTDFDDCVDCEICKGLGGKLYINSKG